MIPIDNRVLILPEPAEDKGQFITPDTARPKPMRGKVIAVGAGERRKSDGGLMPMTCEVGDTAVYSKFGGTDVEIDGVEYVVMKESEVLMVLKPE